jgi:hypothetical protein
VHNSRHHNVKECWEIKKLAEKYREQMKQQLCHEGVPSRQQEGKEKVGPKAEKEEEMEFQNAKRALKDVAGHSDSSIDERHKTLHVMYGGS